MAIRKCSWCKTKFDTESAEARNAPRVYKYCGHKCQCDHAISMVNKQAAKRKERAAKGLPPKKTKRVTSAKEKSLSHNWALTRKVTQRIARARDKFHGYPCITCDKHHKSYDGGHCRGAKANPEVQFHLWNVNAECKNDNWWNENHIAPMKKNIALRYGKARVDWLYSHHEMNPDHSDKDYLERYRRVMTKYAKRWEKYSTNE